MPVEVEILCTIYDYIDYSVLKSTILSDSIKNNMIKKIEEFRSRS